MDVDSLIAKFEEAASIVANSYDNEFINRILIGELQVAIIDPETYEVIAHLS